MVVSGVIEVSGIIEPLVSASGGGIVVSLVVVSEDFWPQLVIAREAVSASIASSARARIFRIVRSSPPLQIRRADHCRAAALVPFSSINKDTTVSGVRVTSLQEVV
jgi:hypothetical protein